MSVASAHRGGPRRAALGGVSLVLRRLRADPGPALTMLVLVAATCFLFAALPRLANRFADEALRYTVARAPLTAKNVRVVEPGRLATAGSAAPLASVAARAAGSQQSLPGSLRDLIERRTFVVHSPRYVLQPGAQSAPVVPGLVRYLNLRVQSGVRPHIQLVAGSFPGTSPVRVRTVDRRIPEVPQAKEVPLLQVALSRTAARELRLNVGERAIFWPDATDIDVQRQPSHDQQPLAVEVSGLFVTKDPQAPFWFGDPTLDTPETQLSPDANSTLVFGQALVSADQYKTVLAATRPLPLEYEYRYYLDATRVDAGRLQSLSAAAARIDARYAGAGPRERRVEIGLGTVLDRYRASRSQAETLLAVAAIGLLTCALANLGLLGALSYDRRRRETGVSRTRGASPLQMLIAQAAEGVLIAAPAALAGWALAVLAISARGSSLSAWLAIAIVAGTVLLLVAAITGVARRSPTPAGRDDIVLARLSWRRLAVEAMVVVAAGLGGYLLRRRGLDVSGPGARGFDPYLAAVPVLLGLACGIVALRVYPLPVTAAARLARRGRGLAIHLGLSRAARQPEITFAPLLVLLLALAIASFSAGMLRTLEQGQDRTGWRVVGADVRVDAAEDESLPAGLISRLDSLGDAAPAYVQEAGAGTEGEETLLIALDLPAYERLVARTPAAVAFPPALQKPPPIIGSVPGIVSPDWPGAGYSLVTLPTDTISLVAVAERASLSGVPRGTPFAVVSLPALKKQLDEPLTPNRLYLRGANVAAVRQAVHEIAPRAEIASRASVVHGLRASPLVENVIDGFRAAILLAALYAMIAVGLMALIAARSRARDLALVRTMGGSNREAFALAAVELAPFVTVALALGIGLGIAILYLIAPGFDLVFFTGNESSAVSISWVAPGAFAAAVLVLVGVAVVVVGLRAQRADLDRVLRIGER